MKDKNFIKVLSTMTVIENYEENLSLEKALTAYDKGTFQPQFALMRVTENEKDGTLTAVIPRNYPSKWIHEKFPDHKIAYLPKHKVKRTVDINCEFEPKDSLQASALNFLDNNYDKSQITLHLKTDSGKTYIALKYICDEKEVAIIVVHTINVLNQWVERISQLTDIRKNEIGIIQGSKSIDKYFDTDKYKIFIAVHKTLSNIIEKDSKKFHKFCLNQDIGIKIIDEVHIEMLNTFWIDAHSNIPKNLYLTATKKRSDWKEDRLLNYILPYCTFGKGGFEVDEEERYHKCYFITYNSHASFEDKQMMIDPRYGFNVNKWATKTIENIDFYIDMVSYYIKKILKKKEKIKIAIVLKSLDQCAAFYGGLIVRGLFEEEEIGMYNGLFKNKKKRQDELKKPIFITTEKSFGAAIDTDIDCLLNLVPQSSESFSVQLLGRLRSRGKGIFVDFSDSSIESCEAAQKKRLSAIKKVSKQIVKWTYKE